MIRRSFSIVSQSGWRCCPANQITDLRRSKNGFDLEEGLYNIRLIPANRLTCRTNTTLWARKFQLKHPEKSKTDNWLLQWYNGRRHRIIQQTHPALLPEFYVQTSQLPVREMANDFVQNNIPHNGCSITRRKFPHMQITDTTSSCNTALCSRQWFCNLPICSSFRSKTFDQQLIFSASLASAEQSCHVTINSEPSFRLTWKWG